MTPNLEFSIVQNHSSTMREKKKQLGRLHLSRQLWINANTEIAFHTKENHPE